MKRIFDDAVNPSNAADLQAKALEHRILMASKGAEGDDSVAGGHKAKGVAQSGNSTSANKKKVSDTYLDIIQMQAQLRSELNTMVTDLGKMGDELYAIDLRMAERQADIDFITYEIHDKDDLLDANGEYNPRAKALLDKYGKSDFPPEEAYIFIQTALGQRLIDAQQVDHGKRDAAADRFNQKQQTIQDKAQQGRDAGMDMTKYERMEANTTEFVNTSKDRAEATVLEQNKVRVENFESADNFDFLLNENPSL